MKVSVGYLILFVMFSLTYSMNGAKGGGAKGSKNRTDSWMGQSDPRMLRSPEQDRRKISLSPLSARGQEFIETYLNTILLSKQYLWKFRYVESWHLNAIADMFIQDHAGGCVDISSDRVGFSWIVSNLPRITTLLNETSKEMQKQPDDDGIFALELDEETVLGDKLEDVVSESEANNARVLTRPEAQGTAVGGANFGRVQPVTSQEWGACGVLFQPKYNERK